VFYEVRKSLDNVKLLKLGYGTTLDGEGIINLGWLSEGDMPLVYNASNVLLHTSEYEGFGMPLLEAMACGIPIVASNKASIPEVVGDCGELVDLDADDCVEQFAEKVLNALDVERNKKGIERAKMFSWGEVARETFRVYKDMIES
jgi:glycosyltransferase involved in cell wall biosynthesis